MDLALSSHYDINYSYNIEDVDAFITVIIRSTSLGIIWSRSSHNEVNQWDYIEDVDAAINAFAQLSWVSK